MNELYYQHGEVRHKDAPFVLALGAFDGIHTGHAALLSETVRLAQTGQALPAALVIKDNGGRYKNASRLFSEEEEKNAFASCGIKALYAIDLEEIRNLSPEDFLEWLLDAFPLTAIVCGFNFRFGFQAEGTAETLVELCRARGLTCSVVPPVLDGDEPVSTSRIRSALLRGDMDTAQRLLGRPYAITGPVIHGNGLGHALLVPTINQALEAPDALCRGVYISRVNVEGKCFPSVTNIGCHPTVPGDNQPHSETHLLGTEALAYGLVCRTELLQFLREERAFASMEELREQIGKDIEQAKIYFAKE